MKLLKSHWKVLYVFCYLGSKIIMFKYLLFIFGCKRKGEKLYTTIIIYKII